MVSFHPYYIPLGVSILFLGLTIYASVVFESDRLAFHAKHHKVEGTVWQIRQTPFRCVEIHSCVCEEAGVEAPSCTSRQRDLTVGECHKGERCCRKSCRGRRLFYEYDYEVDPDEVDPDEVDPMDRGSVQVDRGSVQVDRGSVQVDRGSVQVDRGSRRNLQTSALARRPSPCTPRCVSSVDRESCQARAGNCTQVELEIRYYFLPDGKTDPSGDTYTFLVVFEETCPIAKDACLDKFLGTLREGSTLNLYINEKEPEKAYRSSPDFEPDDDVLIQVILYPIFTACFIAITWRFYVRR